MNRTIARSREFPLFLNADIPSRLQWIKMTVTAKVTVIYYYNLLMHRNLLIFSLSAFYFLLLTACASQKTDSALPSSTLILFATSTRSLPLTTQTPDSVVTAETALPSPTPFTYTIKKGDTISSIAESVKHHGLTKSITCAA